MCILIQIDCVLPIPTTKLSFIFVCYDLLHILSIVPLNPWDYCVNHASSNDAE